MEPSQLSSSPKDNTRSPRPITGQKRRRSECPETVRKRPLPPADSPSDLNPLEPLRPEDNWHCPGCGLICWRCHSSSQFPPDVPSPSLRDESEPERMPSEPPSAPPSDISNHSVKKRKKYEEAGVKYVGPKDADFEDCILIPCGLNLDPRVATDATPSAIFGSQPHAPPSRVFIRKDQKELQEIIQDFNEYERRRYDEHTLSTICNDSIVLRDRFISNIFFDDDQCVVAAVRRDKWKPHKEGPPVPGGAYAYDWDLEPDTTYAVSINMFNAEHRKKLKLKSWHCWLAEENAVCPYLTIEYKCSEKTGKNSDAINQTAAASVLWLHQRKRIRDALDLPLDDIKHYSITIFDSNYSISEARFKDKSYYMHKLAIGLLTRVDDLEKYIGWSNAIHAWGMGPNASSFKEDIEKLVERKYGTQPFLTPPGTLSPMGPPLQKPSEAREVVHEEMGQEHQEESEQSEGAGLVDRQ